MKFDEMNPATPVKRTRVRIGAEPYCLLAVERVAPRERPNGFVGELGMCSAKVVGGGELAFQDEQTTEEPGRSLLPEGPDQAGLVTGGSRGLTPARPHDDRVAQVTCCWVQDRASA